MDQAIRLATFFKNANNKYFIAKFYYTIANTLLRSQQALKILAFNHQLPLVQTWQRVGENPTINCDIFEIIDLKTF
ncbi:4142_t:CDS:2 [Gigaspora margarita]|uniref:4142_t:CDS:1 n=1 Tax=Gigaspora margarita TaxID=4874 RepID=A0ABN7V8T3_GIGMA|nr:4142_t:CDS:2 [Gigaspora margarita]